MKSPEQILGEWHDECWPPEGMGSGQRYSDCPEWLKDEYRTLVNISLTEGRRQGAEAQRKRDAEIAEAHDDYIVGCEIAEAIERQGEEEE